MFTLRYFQKGEAVFKTYLSIKRQGYKKNNIFSVKAKIPLDHEVLKKEERIFSLLPSEISPNFITFNYLGYGTLPKN